MSYKNFSGLTPSEQSASEPWVPQPAPQAQAVPPNPSVAPAPAVEPQPAPVRSTLPAVKKLAEQNLTAESKLQRAALGPRHPAPPSSLPAQTRSTPSSAAAQQAPFVSSYARPRAATQAQRGELLPGSEASIEAGIRSSAASTAAAAIRLRDVLTSIQAPSTSTPGVKQ